MTDSTTLVPVVSSVELGVITANTPAELVARASEAATALAKVITDRKLYSDIQGKRYTKCEGWTTLAAMMGCTPHEVETTETDGVFTATVELRRLTDGQPISRASAECGAPDELDRNSKPVWSTRPRYARRSMAQTRATAKACRMAFSWIMVLSGFQPTPAEEIPEPHGKPAVVPKQDAPTAAVVKDATAGPVLLPVIPAGGKRGTPLKELTSDELVAYMEWCKKKDAYPQTVTAIIEILEERRGL